MMRQLAPLAPKGFLACALVSGILVAGCSGGSSSNHLPYSTHGLSAEGRLATELVGLEVLSVVNTKKTVGDHIATWITGKDCSTIRAQREGAWCVDWPNPPAPPQQVYCYASLARPSCYSQPYNEGNDRLIGFVPAPTPIRR
ncbi:MAG: hypothetical protein ACM31D_18860 [Bacteroidota bacterium]